MGQVLDAWPDGLNGPGRHSLYPWDEWLDGRVHQLEQGTDFDAKPSSVTASGHYAGKRRGKKVRTAVRGKVIFIQSLGSVGE